MSSKEGEDMSQVNHSFGDGPLALFSGLFLLATFVVELGKRQGEYKHKEAVAIACIQHTESMR